MFKMKKINVIGTTGSGKSTFSMRLANKINCAYIQMDELFWKTSWEESLDEEFFDRVKEAISGNFWVLDGNYSRTNDIKWAKADTIIWVDFSYGRTLYQLLKRTIMRVYSKKELWPETGNTESFKKSFMSKKSILLWFFKNYKKNKRRYSELMKSPSIKHIKFIRLRSPREINKYINSISQPTF